MTISLQYEHKEQIELQDFCEYVDKHYKDISLDAMVDLAPLFKSLANNSTFLENFVLNELKDLDKFQMTNPYSAQSLSLTLVPGKYFIRANVWLPERDFHTLNGTGEQRLFAYYQAHDHNFNFMTIGYHGSGYETDIYEYDYALVKGVIGEKVDMRFLETTTLPKGKIMIYRASKDIHIQKLPEEFSISLNLMTPSPTPVRDQFMFNLETGTISGMIRSNFSGRKLLLEAAGYLANDNVSDVLASIAKTHACERTKEAARRALSIRWPEQASALC